METRQNPVLSKSIILVILLSLGYWTFLFFSSEMHIVFDSISYQNSGKRIYTQGWIEHFRTGPNREPLYLYMIAISMQLADFLSVQYQTIQKILQILVMLISQIMLWRILARLKIRPGIITFVLLYWGLSPAINNSALSLFSEIATYPFVLAIIFISILGYQSIKKNKLRRSLVYGLILGLLFIFVTFVKALFGYIFALYLTPFILFLANAVIKRKYQTALSGILFICTSILAFNAFMVPYKMANKKYNGEYTFTNRGPWLLYGNTAKRLQPAKAKDILALIAFTAGDKLCYKTFGKQHCDLWHLDTVERFGAQKRQELEKTLDKPDVDRLLIKASLHKILHTPIKYTFITSIEIFKLFFWESTQIGCVNYSPWQTKIFSNIIFKNSIRLFAFLLTLFSFFGTLFCLTKTGKYHETQKAYIFFTIWLIITFIALHSFFFVVTRYIFPIVPLYLICWAVFLNGLVRPNCD